ncbi:MAG: type II toxin-antitoxin system RelE/ParE family toxin [Chitinophagaceae bacterium]|jgi:toxin ParE1/3/4|nr:type II toxin-antitoxin system RelE/ParE family toxin [Bacteroidota bacterium]MCA6515687.1 type II toxin-antitoxin system RelE/ParE family toxin [Chitinophagaceae bacterium]
MKYVISVEASKDLENIWLYTFENWSQEQADRYFNLIIDEIESISNDTSSGKDFSDIREGYFRSRVKSHFIFYRVNRKKKVIEIIRILHHQMDIESRLND